VPDIANAILCMDADGRIVYANEKGCSWLGCRPDEARGLSFPATDVGATTTWQQLWLQLQSSGSRTIEIESPSGAATPTAHWTAHYVRFGEKEYAIGLLRDMADGCNEHTFLLNGRANFQKIFEGVETGIFIIDPATHRIVDANPVALQLIGAPLHDTVGAVCHQFICPAETKQCPVTDLGQTVDNSERVLLTASSERRSIIKTVRPVELDGHSYLLESFFDITERKRSEQALEQRTSYLNTLIETNPLGTVVLDKEQCVEMSNSAFEQLFLFSHEEVQGKNIHDLIVPGEFAEESIEFKRDCLERKSVHVTSRRRRKDNTLVDVEIYGVPLIIGGDAGGYRRLEAPGH
jgi:PAS domain S-box-containing protein